MGPVLCYRFPDKQKTNPGGIVWKTFQKAETDPAVNPPSPVLFTAVSAKTYYLRQRNAGVQDMIRINVYSKSGKDLCKYG